MYIKRNIENKLILIIGSPGSGKSKLQSSLPQSLYMVQDK